MRFVRFFILSVFLFLFIGCQNKISKEDRIAFVSYRTGSAEIFMMNLDGSDVIQITNSPNNNSFPVQLDKQTIGFTSTDSLRKSKKMKVNIHTKEVTPWIEPEIREDSKWTEKNDIKSVWAFVRSTDYRDRELFIYDEKRNEERQITSHLDSSFMTYSINHSWSPDGNKLIFMSGKDWYNQVIRMYDLESKTITNITHRGYMNSGLKWIDNQTLVANLKIRNKTMYELYRVDIKTGELTQITSDINLHPDVSPDGQHIVFESQRNKNDGDVYIMNSDGTNQKRLTKGESYNGRAIWFSMN
ncbi:MAG: hypothetical protein CMB99_14035 [Flavobacteriaceae bacterium]|nr:hypothetical protein [Flavobacteriaceae bacterium]|tara:strand:- start:96857 stop:97756 length:900 start_codon:yes stop_codon:yes gene_type:complete